MLGSSDLIAFVAVSDIGRARDFYGDVLGLRLVDETSFACVFDVNGAMLRVTAATETARPGYTVLGWRVTDIDAKVDELVAKGIEPHRYEGMVQDVRGIWTTPIGDKVMWFSDPDGNVLSLTSFR